MVGGGAVRTQVSTDVLFALTTPIGCVIQGNMKATLLVRRRERQRPGTFTEIVIWLLPRQLRGSAHRYKYRLALIDQEECVLRYDNEAGKGDHRH